MGQLYMQHAQHCVVDNLINALSHVNPNDSIASQLVILSNKLGEPVPQILDVGKFLFDYAVKKLTFAENAAAAIDTIPADITVPAEALAAANITISADITVPAEAFEAANITVPVEAAAVKQYVIAYVEQAAEPKTEITLPRAPLSILPVPVLLTTPGLFEAFVEPLICEWRRQWNKIPYNKIRMDSCHWMNFEVVPCAAIRSVMRYSLGCLSKDDEIILNAVHDTVAGICTSDDGGDTIIDARCNYIDNELQRDDPEGEKVFHKFRMLCFEKLQRNQMANLKFHENLKATPAKPPARRRCTPDRYGNYIVLDSDDELDK